MHGGMEVSGAHPVESFFERVGALPKDIYPAQLAPIDGRHVDGVAGFPAGRGLYAPCGWDHTEPPPFPYGGLMLVGNHLDAEDAYVEKLAAGAANGDPCPGAQRMRFWTMLYALLDQANIPREQLFVTNVHPALIRGRKATGKIRASEAWLQACGDLLLRQVDVMRPRVVAAMGAPAQEFAQGLFGVRWSGVPDIVSTTGGNGDAIHVVSIRHPSAAQSFEGRRLTAQLLREAMSA